MTCRFLILNYLFIATSAWQLLPSLKPQYYETRPVGRSMYLNENKIGDAVTKMAASFYHHGYYKGELIHVECWHGMHFGMQVSLKLFDKHDIVLYETKSIQSDPLSMQVKLGPEHDGNIFQCYFEPMAMFYNLKLFYYGEYDDTAVKTLSINNLTVIPHDRVKNYACAFYMNSADETVFISVNTKEVYSLTVTDANGEGAAWITSQDAQHIIVKPDKGVQELMLILAFEVRFTETSIDNLQVVLSVVCGSLCFDPYFTRLNSSLVLAKYILENPNRNVMIYQTNQLKTLTFNCTSQHIEKLTWDTETGQYYQICSQTRNGVTIKTALGVIVSNDVEKPTPEDTTVVKQTTENINTTEITKISTENSENTITDLETSTTKEITEIPSECNMTDTKTSKNKEITLDSNTTDTETSKTKEVTEIPLESNKTDTVTPKTSKINEISQPLTPSRGHSMNQTLPIQNLKDDDTNDKGSSNLLVIIISNVVAIVFTIILTVILVKVCKNRRGNRTQDPNHLFSPLRPPNVENFDTEPIYEEVQYSCAGSEGIINIANRPAYPLPNEEREDNKKYVHYNTPYEERIFEWGLRPCPRNLHQNN